jgi:hypothetical protein
MADPPVERSLEPVDSGSVRDATWERLEDQIDWYDRKSAAAQRWYKRVKVVELVVAAAVPPLAALKVSAAVVSVVASLVVVLEGLQHLLQWNEHWIAYRSTCEALKHERYLYLARAGPYATAPEPRVLLAERVEGLVSQEHAKWASTQQQGPRGRDGAGRAP